MGLIVLGMLFMASQKLYASDEFVVVIDAGHGGKDAGATDNGVKEKDINLGVALQLRELLKKQIKGAKVVLTRDKDEYLTLQQRADVANKAKGNIFISIHTNSAAADNPNRTKATGSSSHVLGASKDAKNLAVTQRENSVIKLEKDYQTKYQGFDPDNDASYIIFEMMQKNNLKRSIYLADEIQKGLVNEAGRRDRGVSQNAFWVLWATSMPAVLVELDFICNPNSAKFIASKEGQKKLAEGIAKAVTNYKKNYQSRAFEEAPVEESGFKAGEDVAYLQSGTKSGEKIDKAPEVKGAKAGASSKRRRRSDAAKIKSDNRNLEASEGIIVNNGLTYASTEVKKAVSETTPLPAQKQDEVQPTPVKKSNAVKTKHATKNRTVSEVIASDNTYPAANSGQTSTPQQNLQEKKGEKKDKIKQKQPKNVVATKAVKKAPQPVASQHAETKDKAVTAEKPVVKKEKAVKGNVKAVRSASDIKDGMAEAFASPAGGRKGKVKAVTSPTAAVKNATQPKAAETAGVGNTATSTMPKGKPKRAHLNNKN